jgi:CRP-like cAMP-binding protein
MIETIEPLLASHPVFRNLDPAHVKLLTGCASNVMFNAEQFIFREGEEANIFYVVRHGRVIVETFSQVHGSIGIQSCTDGDVLGWSWLVVPFRWRFDAKATEQTRLIALDGKCLRTKCEEDHDLGYDMMKIFAEIIADRLETTRLQLLDVYSSSS